MSQPLAPDQANRFVHRHFGARAGRLRPLGAGAWSRAYAFTLDGQPMVARFGAYVEDFEKDQRMAAHSSTRLPIPHVLEVGQVPPEAGGGYFTFSRRAYGAFLDELDGEAMRRVLPALLDALAAARAVDLSATSGYGGWQAGDGNAPFPSWPAALLANLDDPPGRRTHGWRLALERSPVGAAAYDEAAEVLRGLAPACPDRRELIHQDLLNRNVLVEGSRITAVLDWGNSLYGDGLYDLAWLLYWWPWFPAWSGIDIHHLVAEHLEGTADAGQRLLCYQLHIGLDAQSYTAFTGRWDDLARNAAQTLELARQENCRLRAGRSVAR